MQLQWFIIVTFISYLMFKIFYSVIVDRFLMMSSLLSEDISVEKGSTINNSSLLTRNSLQPTICDNYTLTRSRNMFVSFLVSVQQSNLQPYWYYMSNNNACSLRELLRVKERYNYVFCRFVLWYDTNFFVNYYVSRSAIIIYFADLCSDTILNSSW